MKEVSKGLKLYGEPLERARAFKFLTVWLDEKLTYKERVSRTVSKCEKILNNVRCAGGCSKGADRKLMLMIYKAMIRAVFDYGCLAYDSAAKSTLEKLDVAQFRLLGCAPAFWTTPIPALLVETGKAALRLWCAKLALNYVIKLKFFGTALSSSSLLAECWEVGKVRCSFNTETLHSVKID